MDDLSKSEVSDKRIGKRSELLYFLGTLKVFTLLLVSPLTHTQVEELGCS